MWFTVLVSAGVAAPTTLTTADGVQLSADAWGKGERAVLLVHDEGRSRADWAPVAPRIASGGMQVLAIDLRGHGASGTGPIADADWPKLEQDVAAGVKWLTAHGATEIHVVGARFGAAIALQAASHDPAVDDLVLLSPAPLHGVKVSAAAAAYGARPLLIVSSTDDAIVAKTAAWLDSTATGHHQLLTFAGAGSGAQMLNKVASLETSLLGWLGGDFSPKTGQQEGLQNAVKTNMDSIQTTGTRLEDR